MIANLIKLKLINILLIYYAVLFWGLKEGNVLFNDILNTFYLRLYGVGHMVKEHSDSKTENPHWLLFLISSKGSFICIIPDRITYTTVFVTPVVEHWLVREIAQWVHHEGSIWPIAPFRGLKTINLWSIEETFVMFYGM